jgi:hypothetical protein
LQGFDENIGFLDGFFQLCAPELKALWGVAKNAIPGRKTPHPGKLLILTLKK